ncbi:hypothetical protein P308_03090 [Pseudomonas piscis]|nr:hypothetical protein P308_03090 [Pseudomonas piscis]
MSFNSLFRSLLAAYACGASGTHETSQRDV